MDIPQSSPPNLSGRTHVNNEDLRRTLGVILRAYRLAVPFKIFALVGTTLMTTLCPVVLIQHENLVAFDENLVMSIGFHFCILLIVVIKKQTRGRA